MISNVKIYHLDVEVKYIFFNYHYYSNLFNQNWKMSIFGTFKLFDNIIEKY